MMPSRPSHRNSHSACGERMPPGRMQLMPTMAMPAPNSEMTASCCMAAPTSTRDLLPFATRSTRPARAPPLSPPTTTWPANSSPSSSSVSDQSSFKSVTQHHALRSHARRAGPAPCRSSRQSPRPRAFTKASPAVHSRRKTASCRAESTASNCCATSRPNTSAAILIRSGHGRYGSTSTPTSRACATAIDRQSLGVRHAEIDGRAGRAHRATACPSCCSER